MNTTLCMSPLFFRIPYEFFVTSHERQPITMSTAPSAIFVAPPKEEQLTEEMIGQVFRASIGEYGVDGEGPSKNMLEGMLPLVKAMYLEWDQQKRAWQDEAVRSREDKVRELRSELQDVNAALEETTGKKQELENHLRELGKRKAALITALAKC